MDKKRSILTVSICLLLTAAIACGFLYLAGRREDTIHLPVISGDASTPTGQKTTWSTVWYGSYPDAEVVSDSWNAVDEYALMDGDVIRDSDLYSRLEDAEWNGNTTEMDGTSYYRISADDTPVASEVREQHYVWGEDHEWHYFRISPIRWRVLDINGDRALLLADRMPDCVPYNDSDTDVTWSSSSLRSWLNGYFVDHAFSSDEKEAIVPTACSNAINRDYGTDSGPDTEDLIFILSNEDVFEGENAAGYGFHASRDFDDPAKRFTSTLYAKIRGAWWSPVDAYKGNSFWFMRTNGYNQRSVTYICDFGYIYSRGTLATCSDAGILPAMWIDLGRAKIAYAGEVCSTDIMNNKEVPADTDLKGPSVIPDDSAPGEAYTVWNSVSFGHYPQTEVTADTDPGLYASLRSSSRDSDGSVVIDGVRYVETSGRWFRCDEIIWRVLEVSDGEVLLMADRCLDSMPFHNEYCDVDWEDSDIRNWLNNTFVDMAFNEEEQRALIVSRVSNADNYYFGTSCGRSTDDRVFILAEEEVFSSARAEQYGFRPSDAIPDPGRRIMPTEYAAAHGTWRSENPETSGKGFWFLRTNGYTGDNVVYVGEKGYLYNRGIPVTCSDAGIVPVIRIRLDSGLYVREQDISSLQGM